MGWEIITPSKAAEYLTRNTGNYRIFDHHKADTYAQDMRAGRWIANGEPIVFNKSGKLQDGQHRLNAIILANVPVKIYVIHDAEETNTYDVGCGRTISQVLRAEGLSLTSLGSAITRIMIQGGITNIKVAKQLSVDYAKENADAIKKAETIVSQCGSVGKKAACAAIVYCFIRNGEIPENEMNEFFKILNTGNVVGIERDPSPALVLRRQLTEMKKTGSFFQRIQLEATAKALIDYHSNVTRKNNYKADSKIAERLIKDVNGINFQYIPKAS